MIEASGPEAAARAWVEAWSKGWATHDSDLIASRYALDCVFSSHPFRPRASGRAAAGAWMREAFASERTARFEFGEPIVATSGRAAVEHRAVITAQDGRDSTLAGTTVLRFGRDGLVVEHRDYWAIADGDLGLDQPGMPRKEAST